MILEAAWLGLTILHDAGFEAYIVGGAVRDWLLGRCISDIDIATNATPPELQEVFQNYVCIPTGLKHGTLTVLLQGIPLEITTYRIDGEYSDKRRPDQVFFTPSLEEDMKRRDFTINAMALDFHLEDMPKFSPSYGNQKNLPSLPPQSPKWLQEHIVDYFGGVEDVHNRILRAVLDPYRRFKEDSLRILRGLRLASELQFEIHPETAQAMVACQALLSFVAVERIQKEWNKLLLGKNVLAILKAFSGIFFGLIPPLKELDQLHQHNIYHMEDVWGHTLLVIQHSPPLLHIRLGALFHDLGKSQTFSLDAEGQGHFWNHAKYSCTMAEEILKNLKYDKKTISQVLQLVKYHDLEGLEDTSASIKKWLKKVGQEGLKDLLALRKADVLGQNPAFYGRLEKIKAIEKRLEEIIVQTPCIQLQDLAVKGRDLLEIGIAPGPEMGKILRYFLDLVVEEKAINQKEALLAYLPEALEALEALAALEALRSSNGKTLESDSPIFKGEV